MSATINAANFLMLSVFGIAAVGYLLGRITIKGISLGTAGVFVIALIYGAFSGTHFNSKFVIEEINYASQALKIIENLGLVFFVTSVGFIAGPNFFKNMKHNFKSYVLLGVVIILSGGITAVLCLLVGRAIEAGQPGLRPEPAYGYDLRPARGQSDLDSGVLGNQGGCCSPVSGRGHGRLRHCVSVRRHRRCAVRAADAARRPCGSGRGAQKNYTRRDRRCR